MDVEFSELHAFVVLAGELHFRKASERLFLSQPALSKRIQRLEEKVKGALFVRSRRKVALTDAGRSFLPKAAKLLQDAEDALRETRAAVEGRAGTLRIGFGIASVSEILPRTILRFRKLYPEVELHMREMPSPSQVSSLIEGRLDAGILRMPVSNPKLVSVPLFSEDLVLAIPSDAPHRLKKGIGGFRNSGFIFVSPSVSETFHDRVLSLCLKAGFTPRVVQEANEILTILHLVRAGVGVSLVPRSAMRLKVPGVRFHELGWNEPLWRIGIAWNRNSEKLTLISRLLKVVQAVVGDEKV
jgi:DNA-binding transcriptional LysR family regulator